MGWLFFSFKRWLQKELLPLLRRRRYAARRRPSWQPEIDCVLEQRFLMTTTSLNLTATPNPADYRLPVMLTATITAGDGTSPSGTITFFDGLTVVGSSSLSVVGGHDRATLSLSSLAVGSHSLDAVYSGPSVPPEFYSNSTSGFVTETINQATTTLSLSASVNPSAYGETVSFNAAVTPEFSGTPTGTVTFYDGGTSLGYGTLTPGGVATFATSSLSVATHAISATYGGDSNFDSSSASYSEPVAKATSSISLSLTPTGSVYGQTVTFTGVVAPEYTGTPTGTLTFYDGGTSLGYGTLSSGTATFSTTSLTVGGNSITAVYGGDGNFSGSSAGYAVGVGKANTSSGLSPSANPAAYGQAVTFTDHITPQYTGTPTGIVTFYNGGTFLGTATLGGGSASYTPTSLPIGISNLTAVYGGDANFYGSTATYTETVNPAGTSLSLTSNFNPSVYTQPVTFTATVSVPPPGGGTPTGTVQFTVDGSSYTVPLVSGTATYSTSSLAIGSHGVTAAYSGDGNYLGGAAVTLTQVVNDPFHLTAQLRNSDPYQGYLLPLGEATVDLNEGALLISQPLDFAQSDDGRSQQNFALTYNSATVHPTLVVEGALTSSNVISVPYYIGATLKVDGVVVTSQMFSTTGHFPGDTYLFTLDGSVSGSGQHAWELDLNVGLAGGTVTETYSGTVAEADRTTSVYGSGWGISGIDQLVPITGGGVVWISGNGDARLFTGAYPGSGTYTYGSPPGDFGTLFETASRTFLYTGKDGSVETFNTSGQETSWKAANAPSWSFAYSGNELTAVTAPDGGNTTLGYGGSYGLLTSVAEPGSRTLTFSDSFTTGGGYMMTQVRDVDGSTRVLGYDAYGRLSADQWSPWNSSFSYDSGSGRLTGVTLGTVESYHIVPAALEGVGSTAGYASAQGVASVTDGLSHATTYVLDRLGHRTQEIQPGSLTQSWAYDSSGDVTLATDARTLSTTSSYDAFGDVTLVVNPDTSTLQYAYDSTFHKVTKSVDGDGITTLYSLDAFGNVTSVVEAPGTTAAASSTYNWSNGLLTSMVDADGNRTSSSYNSFRQLTAQQEYDFGSNLIDSRSYSYNGAGYATTTVDGVGGSTPETTGMTYDGRGQALSEVDPSGVTTLWSYLAAGNVAKTTDGDGNVTTDTFNAAGQVTGETVVDALARTVSSFSEGFDAAGRETALVDGDYNTYVYGYDSDDRQTLYQEYDAGTTLVRSSTTGYDPDGNITKVVDGAGTTTLFGYDAEGRQTSVQVSDGVTVTGSETDQFDKAGNVTNSVDGDGNRTTSTYSLGLLLQRVMLDGTGNTIGYESYQYDGDYNVTWSKDGAGNTAVSGYDGGRLTLREVFDSAGTTLISYESLAYDRAGHVTKLVDGDGNTTLSGYNGNELTQQVVTDGAGITSSYQSLGYDRAGNVTSSIDGDHNTTLSGYDGNQMTAQTVLDYTGTATVSYESLAYDQAGNVTKLVDGAGNTTLSTYDGNQLTQQVVIDRYSQTIGSATEGYDKAGNVTKVVDGDHNTTLSGYDGNQLTAQTVLDYTGTATVSYESLAYDQNGLVTKLVDGVGNTTLSTYDGNQLIQRVVTDRLGTTVGFESDSYDKAGNVTKVVDGDGNTTLSGYDGNQLTVQTVLDTTGTVTVSYESLAYDQAGNVTKLVDGVGNTTLSGYDGNQLTVQTVLDYTGTATVGYEAFGYDKAGNVTSAVDGDHNTTLSGYDGNQLTAQTVLDYTGTATVSYESLAYDQAGNVTKLVDGVGNTTLSGYDGNQLTQQYMTDRLGATISYESLGYDQAGNVTKLVDGVGNTTLSSYDGNQLIQQILIDRYALTIGFESASYDKAGEVTKLVDGDGNTTLSGYDGNQLTVQTVLDTTGTVTVSYESLAYDQAVNVTKLVDGDHNTTLSGYDGNQMTAQTVLDYTGTATVSYEALGYDKAGNVTSAVDGDHNTTLSGYDGNQMTAQTVLDYTGTATVSYESLAYDQAGNVTKLVDGVGNTTLSGYDGNQLTSQVELDYTGTATVGYEALGYDKAGNVTSAVDGDHNTTLSGYDGNQLTAQTVLDYTGTATIGYQSLAYDQAGNVTKLIDGVGNTTLSGYDGNQLTQVVVTDHYGTTISFESEGYDRAGNVTKVVDGDHNTTLSGYDGNQLTAQTVLDYTGTATIGYQSLAYDQAGNVTKLVDGVGNTTLSGYDGNQLTQQVVNDGSGRTVSYEGLAYDQAGNVTKLVDGVGNTTLSTYDGNQLIQRVVTDRLGTTVGFESDSYDKAGNVTKLVDGVGNTTLSGYDGNQLTQQVVNDGSGHTVSYESLAYDRAGNVTKLVDGVGNTTLSGYDGNQLTVQTVLDYTGTTTIGYEALGYDQAGNVTSVVDGDYNTTLSGYDGNQMTAQTVLDYTGTATVSYESLAYDQAGNVTKLIDGVGNTTLSSYDGNQITQQVVTDQYGVTTSFESEGYDKAGNVTSLTDGDGNVTRSIYDGGELVTSIAGYGTTAAATSIYGYDAAGNRTSYTDPVGNVTSYTYNASGQVLTTTNHFGTATNAYDAAGNLTYAKDLDGRTIVSQYDGNELVSQTWYNSGGTATNHLSWSYDSAGNVLTAIKDGTGSTMTYDGNRVVTRSDPSGVTLTYGYDKDSNVTRVVDSQGGTTSYGYDGNQIATKTYQNGSTQLGVSFAYDKAGNVLTEKRYSNVALTTLVGSTTSGYDGNQVTAITDYNASGTVLQSFDYWYDHAGRLTTQTANGVYSYYTYDATGQLIYSGTQTYSYDANGNHSGAGATTTYDNELTNYNGTSYSYDTAGNETKSVDSVGTTWTYGYDVANHLTTAVETVSGVAVESVSYTYDAFGNRSGRTVTNSSGTSTQYFVYDVANTLYADTDGSGTVTTRYLSDVTGTNMWLARVDSGGGAWLLGDHQGSIMAIVSMTDGSHTDLTYDAFGKLTNVAYHNASGMTIGVTYAPPLGELGYQGGLYDSVTTLDHFNARDYDPTSGRWLQQDPLGLTPDSNPYRFVGNGPTNGTDPSGMAAPSLIHPEPGSKQTYERVLVLKNPDQGGSGWMPASNEISLAVSKAPTQKEPIQIVIYNGARELVPTYSEVEYRTILAGTIVNFNRVNDERGQFLKLERSESARRRYFLWSDTIQGWYEATLPLKLKEKPDSSYGDVSNWSPTQKIVKALKESAKYMGPQLKAEFEQIATPENLGIMASTAIGLAALHGASPPAAAVVDTLLTGTALIFGGAEGVEGGWYIGQASIEAADAKRDWQIEAAAGLFAYGFKKAGFSILMAVDGGGSSPRSNGQRIGERLPTGGNWRTAAGELGVEGNSLWHPPAGSGASQITGGLPVPYINGQPDFSNWSKVTVKAAITGGRDSRDVRNATRQLAQELIEGKHSALLKEFEQAGLTKDVYSQVRSGEVTTNVDALKNWLTQKGYTWHHTPNLEGYQLVPSILNTEASHAGGASYARKIMEGLNLTAEELERVKSEGLSAEMIQKARRLGLIP